LATRQDGRICLVEPSTKCDPICIAIQEVLRHSRVYASTTLNTRITRPQLSAHEPKFVRSMAKQRTEENQKRPEEVLSNSSRKVEVKLNR